MVDINLFKEDEEEEKEWQPDSADDETNSGSDDAFDDDLGFDDALDSDIEPELETEESSDDDFLDNEEAVPEFEDEDVEEDEDLDEELDYDYGETKEKKAPVWLWIVLVFVVLGACFYLFILPKLTPSLSTDIPRQSEVATSDNKPVVKPDTTKVDSVNSSTIPGKIQSQSTTMAADQSKTISAIQTKSNTAAVFSVSQTIFDNLAKQNQFGAVLISDDQFMIQYASETAGVANAMGHRVKALLGVTQIKISPEDRNVKGNRVRYEGVISGTLPNKSYSVSNPVVKQYANAGQFEKDVKAMLAQNQLKIQSIQKLSATSSGVPVRVKAEGIQVNMLKFMNSFKNIQGNILLEKLFLSPAGHTDFEAENVKVVLDFVVVNH